MASTATQDITKPDLSKAEAHAKALAAAPSAKATVLSKEDLLKLITEGSTDLKVFEQLQALNKGEEATKLAKTETVKKLVKAMADHDITFIDLKTEGAPVPDIDKLFDATTIKLAAGVTKIPRALKESDGTPKVKRPSKALMIALPANGKRPAGYGKGDSLGTYTKAAFKDLFIKHGEKFETIMDGFKSPEGKEFYATPEGKLEWTAIINHIKTKKVAPEAAK